MSDPSEHNDIEQGEEVQRPVENEDNINVDSEDEDEFPEFGNDENKKLF